MTSQNSNYLLKSRAGLRLGIHMKETCWVLLEMLWICLVLFGTCHTHIKNHWAKKFRWIHFKHYSICSDMPQFKRNNYSIKMIFTMVSLANTLTEEIWMYAFTRNQQLWSTHCHSTLFNYNSHWLFLHYSYSIQIVAIRDLRKPKD